MAVADQVITDQYAIYLGDCVEVLTALPSASIHLSLYSPPFCGLYLYSSDERDFSNCLNYEEFMEQYDFLVQELTRVTVPGRMTAVHCMDVPSGNTGRDVLRDFPGDIIRMHERHGWSYVARYAIWKDPYAVYLRTMQKSIQHRTVIEDASHAMNAGADYLIVLRREGTNPVPIAHPEGLLDYAGARSVPQELLRWKAWPNKQTENKYSQWIWRQYASCFWDDVRLDRVLPYQDTKGPDDEKHVHPLQLDVIDRCVVLWSNPGETVLDPFGGVGSTPFGAVAYGRRGLAIELKASYYRQMVKNLQAVEPHHHADKQADMFADVGELHRGTADEEVWPATAMSEALP